MSSNRFKGFNFFFIIYFSIFLNDFAYKIYDSAKSILCANLIDNILNIIIIIIIMIILKIVFFRMYLMFYSKYLFLTLRVFFASISL